MRCNGTDMMAVLVKESVADCCCCARRVEDEKARRHCWHSPLGRSDNLLKAASSDMLEKGVVVCSRKYRLAVDLGRRCWMLGIAEAPHPYQPASCMDWIRELSIAHYHTYLSTLCRTDDMLALRML